MKPELQAEDIDERLLVEAAQRDRARFAELYERNFDRVYAYVARRVADRSVAEDVVSEVFHHALANLDKFEWRGVPFCAWLYRIAANAMVDRHERSTRESGNVAEAPEAAVTDDVERRALLSQLVNSLPPEQRRVVVQRFVEQRSIKEIARAMQRSEGAVKQLQFRALQTLRARMEDANA